MRIDHIFYYINVWYCLHYKICTVNFRWHSVNFVFQNEKKSSLFVFHIVPAKNGPITVDIPLAKPRCPNALAKRSTPRMSQSIIDVKETYVAAKKNTNN